MSERKRGCGLLHRRRPQCGSWRPQVTPEAVLRWTNGIMLLVFFFSKSVLSRNPSCRCWGLTFHRGVLEGRLFLPFRFLPFRFRPVQDPVIAHWNFSLMTFNFFFKFVSVIWAYSVFRHWQWRVSCQSPRREHVLICDPNELLPPWP